MRIATLAILSVALGAVRAHADDYSEIRKTYTAFGFALAAKDLTAIRKWETRDFVAIENGARFNSKQFDALLARQFAGEPAVYYFRVKNASVNETGSTATMDGQFWFRAQLKNVAGAKKPPILDISGRIATVMVRTGGVYKIRSIDQKIDVTAIAGKRIGLAPNAYGTVP